MRANDAHLSPVHTVTRAQPWLGTFVSIRASGPATTDLHAAIDTAFQQISHAHRRMSFHSPHSDVSHLNRDAASRAVRVDEATLHVLRCAHTIAVASDGCFDITVAEELVRRGILPCPGPTPGLSSRATFRDIELLNDNRVRFHRPLWIDLGGIAKGYAVDRAAAALLSHGITQACINAGGDLRVWGPVPERIHLRLDYRTTTDNAAIDLTNASAAASSGYLPRHVSGQSNAAPHLDGRARRCNLPHKQFACVVAGDCMHADALTKVVLAQGCAAANLLAQFNAAAYTHHPRHGWQTLPAQSSAA